MTASYKVKDLLEKAKTIEIEVGSFEVLVIIYDEPFVNLRSYACVDDVDFSLCNKHIKFYELNSTPDRFQLVLFVEEAENPKADAYEY